jgi:hypothetical protein
MHLTVTSYFFNCNRGNELLERGVVPFGQAIQLSRIAAYAREPALRQLARQAVVRFGLGELIGERRGAA